MKANFPNQRAMKTRNTTVAMTVPRTPRNQVTDTSELGGLKCDSKAAWETECNMLTAVPKKHAEHDGSGLGICDETLYISYAISSFRN
jgi:hypothetical protein